MNNWDSARPTVWERLLPLRLMIIEIWAYVLFVVTITQTT